MLPSITKKKKLFPGQFHIEIVGMYLHTQHSCVANFFCQQVSMKKVHIYITSHDPFFLIGEMILPQIHTLTFL